MRKSATLLALASLAVAGLTALSAAHDSQNPSGSTDRPGMTDRGGMTGMMSMMGRMGSRMEHCGRMMQDTTDGPASGRPNEQWRKDRPAHPGTDG